MNVEFLSRIQFALTASFHFIYPPISMGLGLLMVVMGALYLKTKDPVWRQSSFFWVRVYGLVFAMGIATGVVQEFAFGTNWAMYSRFVGNIFGSLLAAEGIFAFFLEGGFLGLMLFGGARLGPRLWLLSSVLVVFGAHFSALWILMANSWMQSPQGYTLQQTQWGQLAFMANFASVVFTPTFYPRLMHTFMASWMIGASLVMSVGAWYVIKQQNLDFAKKNLTLGLWAFALFSFCQALFAGPRMAIAVTANQQPKLAAMEGVWNSQSCAPMYFVGWVNVEAQTTKGFHIPCLLSILAYGDPHATVTGLNSFPSNTWAPINVVFQVYHVMIDLGSLFPLIALLGIATWLWKRRLFAMRWLLSIMVVTIVLTEVSTIAGWWTAETGRQPWIVWNLLRTADGVSVGLNPLEVAASLTMFILLYALLFVLFIFLLDRIIRGGPEAAEELSSTETLPDTFREIFRKGRFEAG
jgi:cytochrome bd ubiquinol oxidase subunit I